MSHECPVRGCTASVADHKLLCRFHWNCVPTKVQQQVYAAWNGGKGKGTEAHDEAITDAIYYANLTSQEED